MDSPIQQYSIEQLRAIRDNFVSQLKAADTSQPTSLGYIRTPLPTQPVIRKKDYTFQVMSIGGTNFQTALANVTNYTINLGEIVSQPLPSISAATDLFAFILTHLDEDITLLSLNFAYELAPVLRDQILDGRLVSGGKENSFPDLLGQQIGYQLEKYLFQQTKRQIDVAITNDSLCLALAKTNSTHPPTSIVSGIVGTGYNLGFFSTSDTFINLESGEFNQFPATKTGEYINQHSNHPGSSTFEKEVAGAYLYQHFNLIVDWHKLPLPHLSSSDELSTFAREGHGLDSLLAQQLLQRSASLVAAQLAGIYKFKQWHHRHSEIVSKPKNDKQAIGLTFVMEGSLFWQGWNYKTMVKTHTHDLGIAKKKLHFTKVHHSNLLGAAKLVCLGMRDPVPPPPEPVVPDNPPTHGEGHDEAASDHGKEKSPSNPASAPPKNH